jgi:hypothetical protein
MDVWSSDSNLCAVAVGTLQMVHYLAMHGGPYHFRRRTS